MLKLRTSCSYRRFEIPDLLYFLLILFPVLVYDLISTITNQLNQMTVAVFNSEPLLWPLSSKSRPSSVCDCSSTDGPHQTL